MDSKELRRALYIERSFISVDLLYPVMIQLSWFSFSMRILYQTRSLFFWQNQRSNSWSRVFFCTISGTLSALKKESERLISKRYSCRMIRSSSVGSYQLFSSLIASLSRYT